MGYIGGKISYTIAKHIIKVRYISLGNLILDRLAFRELIQDDCSPENLVLEVRAMIEDRGYRQRMLGEYEMIKKALGGAGASKAVAADMIMNVP